MSLQAYQNQIDRIITSPVSYRTLMLLMEGPLELASLARNAANRNLGVQQCEQFILLMMDYADTAPLNKVNIVRINNLTLDYHIALGMYYNSWTGS